MSNPSAPLPGTPSDWLAHARSDLAYARLGERDPDVLPNQTAFHTQQAAEKALKAVLLQHGIAFPKTHDLKDLIRRWTAAGQTWPAELGAARTLNPYAFETRYPGYIHQISRAEVRAAIEAAERVVAWAEVLVKSPPGQAGN